MVINYLRKDYCKEKLYNQDTATVTEFVVANQFSTVRDIQKTKQFTVFTGSFACRVKSWKDVK